MWLAATIAEARDWFDRIVLRHCLDDRSGSGWHDVRSSGGFQFVPLRTADGLLEEGRAMNHCVAAYADKLSVGACLIYSVRRAKRRVATMEVMRERGGTGKGRIAQLQGHGNTKPGDDVIDAARLWLARQGDYPLTAETGLAMIGENCGGWDAVWRPYCEAKPQFAAQLMPPRLPVLAKLYADLKALAKWREY
ncbi:MAG: hypothetical protein HC850_06815 [Rhodomicrobium sp.]|nr:hypothetical protein [Rhodomicrobium sp.]